MDPFASLFGPVSGGLGFTGGEGGSAGPSQSGPNTSPQAVSYANGVQNASPFIVSGAGSQVSATTSASQAQQPNASAPTGASNMAVYLALGFAALALIGTLAVHRR